MTQDATTPSSPITARASLTFTVGTGDTARALGSGDVDVLATPRLVAWCEAATVAALGDLLPEGSTSVGTRVSIDHLAPTPVGRTVEVSAVLTGEQGRGRSFEIGARDSAGTAIAAGRVDRVVVDRDRFTARANASQG